MIGLLRLRGPIVFQAELLRLIGQIASYPEHQILLSSKRSMEERIFDHPAAGQALNDQALV